MGWGHTGRTPSAWHNSFPSGCQSEPINASSIENILIFSLEHLELCLSGAVLMENLEAVLDQPITSQISQLLKKKVDEVRGARISPAARDGQDTLWEQGWRCPSGSLHPFLPCFPFPRPCCKCITDYWLFATIKC